MKYKSLSYINFFLVIVLVYFKQYSFAQIGSSPEAKAIALLQKMTLEEKVGQMAQITLDALGKQAQPGAVFQLDNTKLNEAIVKYKLGSVLNASDNSAMSTGSRTGKEVIQLFISDLIASLSPDIKRLRGFEKINLHPGEEQKLLFNIPVKELAFVNADNKWLLENGEFRVQVNNLHQHFFVNKTITWQ